MTLKQRSRGDRAWMQASNTLTQEQYVPAVCDFFPAVGCEPFAEGGVGGNERINDADEREGESRRVVLRLIFLGRRRKSPGLLLPCLQAMPNGSGSGVVLVQTNKHKDDTSK